MGGPTASRKTHPIRLHKVWSDAAGRYGEPLGEQIKGVEGDDFTVVSRTHVWEIVKAWKRAARPGKPEQEAASGPVNGRQLVEGLHNPNTPPVEQRIGRRLKPEPAQVLGETHSTCDAGRYSSCVGISLLEPGSHPALEFCQ
jgi:hypothetical protein